jgi:meso-butanediol dehydrogenase / (S,S)-butanediol dehydrogenase / diacetyl reductase
MTSQRFQGKAAIVTGAASGIGRATAERLAAEGAALVLADRAFEALPGLASELYGLHGSKIVALRFDAEDAESCRRMVEHGVAALGRLDVLCNIAGILDWGHFADFTEARWERILRINLTSLFHISQHALPHLIAARGNIVNMASASGLIGIAYTAAYCASKAGVIALTKSLAVEYAEAGVRINAVAPGGIDTPMLASTPPPEGVDPALIARLSPKLRGGALGAPEDIAAAVAYLASDEARFITGTVLSVDGGQTAG